MTDGPAIVRPDGTPYKLPESEMKRREEVLRKLHAEKLAEADVRSMSIADKDVVIITAPEDFSKQEISIILKLVMEHNPNWDGPVICLTEGQTWEKMDEDTARKMWAILNKHFGTKSREFKALRALVKLSGDDPTEEQRDEMIAALRRFVGS